MAAVTAVVAVFATNMDTTMVTIVSGGNRIGRHGDCTVPGLGS